MPWRQDALCCFLSWQSVIWGVLERDSVGPSHKTASSTKSLADFPGQEHGAQFLHIHCSLTPQVGRGQRVAPMDACRLCRCLFPCALGMYLSYAAAVNLSCEYNYMLSPSEPPMVGVVLGIPGTRGYGDR